MKKTFFLLVGVIFTLLSCEHDHTQTPQKREHTVLIYMLAENNISECLANDFQEIVQGMKHAPASFGAYVYIDDWDVPRLYEITSSGTKLIRQYPELNSATSVQLRNVLNLVESKSPSRSYGLIMSSHGYDWIPASPWNKSQVSAPTSVSPKFFGDDGGKYMDISDIEAALNPKELLYLGFDACYMSSIEIAYRLQSKMSYMVASPMEILVDGFPYHLMIPILFSGNLNEQPESVLRAFCTTYFEFYRDNPSVSDRYGAISLIKTSALEQLASACQPVLTAQGGNLSNSILQGTQFYERQHDPSWVYDLYAYLSKLATPSQLSVIGSALDSCVIYKNSTDYLPYSSTRVETYSGFGCYIPAPAMDYNAAYVQEPWYLRTYISQGN